MQKHNPGGKVELKLQLDVSGDCYITPDQKYRPWLKRSWANGQIESLALWIGMNPSTARDNVDDPTVRREVNFTKAWGFNAYYKCNVCDYRLTNPAMLASPTIMPRSRENVPTILKIANRASIIILAYGALHPRIQKYADELVELLDQKYQLYCLGWTQSGNPKHSLYLPKYVKPERFNAL